MDRQDFVEVEGGLEELVVFGGDLGPFFLLNVVWMLRKRQICESLLFFVGITEEHALDWRPL